MSSLKQYVQDAIRTESQIDVIVTNRDKLLEVMTIFVMAGNMLDALKKNIFYGKEINETSWDSNLENIKDVIGGRLLESDVIPLIAPEPLSIDPRLFHALIGIATESTELIEAIQKALHNNVDIDHVNVQEELGDLNWYQAIAVDASDADWDKILDTNIAKLKHRYPEKFTADRAINRDLETERRILEDNHQILDREQGIESLETVLGDLHLN